MVLQSFSTTTVSLVGRYGRNMSTSTYRFATNYRHTITPSSSSSSAAAATMYCNALNGRQMGTASATAIGVVATAMYLAYHDTTIMNTFQ
jgi:hypothetical protein